MHKIIILLIFITLNLWGAVGDYVVLDRALDKQTIDEKKALYMESSQNIQTIIALQNSEKFNVSIEELDGVSILKVGPFKSQDALAIFYLEIKETFKSAFILEKERIVKKEVIKIVEKEVVEDTTAEEHEEAYTIWIALFGLGAVAFIALFLSSEQISTLKKEHQKMREKQDEIKLRQDKMISDMSENIHTIAKETFETTNELVKKASDGSMDSEIEKVKDSENKLLDVTSSLIEFLRLKSKKIKIVNENFELLNLLNDITGTLSTSFEKSDLELVYDIHKDISDTIVGDTLNLSKILVNLLEYCARNGSTQIVLSVDKSGILSKESTLNFLVQTDLKMKVTDDESFFESSYNEKTQRYDNLGLYVAKELSLLMDGELLARDAKDKTVEFALTLPFISSKKDKSITPIKLQKEMLNKKVIIIDSNVQSYEALEKIFLNLKYSVKTYSKDEFLIESPDFEDCDILVIDEKLFLERLDTKLHKLQSSKNLKVMLLGNLFNSNPVQQRNDIPNISLRKPLTREMILDAIISVYSSAKATIVTAKEPEVQKKKLLVHRELFADTPNVTLHRFVQFKGTSVLLVEDNLINQKVLLSVLSKSGIYITVANNGQEALDMLNGGLIFDLVLMDINMPIMDGFTATQKIRENPELDGVPVVSLTALISKDEINKMFDSGMNGYLAKPFYKERLFTVFAMFLKDGQIKDRRVEKKPVEQNNRYADKIQKLENLKDLKDLKLAGLDTQKGIAQTNGNAIFYSEVLQEFKDAYGNSDETLASLIEEFRYEQLRMLCLDMKGLSGAIGATDIHDISTEIMQRLVFKKYDLLPAYIDEYSKKLEILNDSIDKYITLS